MVDLLQEIVESEENTQRGSYPIFSIGKQHYGIYTKDVIEIIGIEQITEVPELPNYIKGVIDISGKIIPVMDARLKLEKEEKQYDGTCIIVVEIEGRSIGLMQNEVRFLTDWHKLLEENEIKELRDKE